MARRRQRISKPKPDPTVMLALSIVPAAQVANDRFVECNVANHSENDQRHTVRSGEKKTVRRFSHIDWLVVRKTLSAEHGKLCQWYADQHELGYSTIGCTANYCGTGGGGFGSTDLLSRHITQARARDNYAMARDAIPNILRPLFERVVIGGLGLGEAGGYARYSRLSRSFRLAVETLEREIGHLVSIDR